MDVSRATAEVVIVAAHLDVRNIGSVRTVINEALEASTGDVVVDMGSLELIDSAALGMLTAAHLRAERAGRHLVLRNCSDDIRRVLAVTRLNRILRIDRSKSNLSLTA